MKRYFFPQEKDAHLELTPDLVPVTIVGVPDKHPSNGADCQSFDVPDTVPNNSGAWLQVSKKGFSTDRYHGTILALTSGMLIDILPMHKQGGIRPFRLDGHFCRHIDDGTEMLINMTTGFRLGERFKNNLSAADAFCQSMVENNLTSARVTLMQDTSIYLPPDQAHLHFRIHPDEFGSLGAWQVWVNDLTDYLEGWSILPSYVLCTQTQTLMRDPAKQRAYVSATMEALKDRYLLMSFVNEHGIYDNSVDGSVLLMQKPAGANFLLSTGSLDSSNRTPFLPIHDHIEEHFNDSNEWQRKSKDVMDDGNALDRGGYVSETTRTDKDTAAAGIERALRHYEDHANVAMSMTMAALIHTQEGKNADPFGFSVPHIAAHNRGIALGGIAYRRGRYTREPTPPDGMIRLYYMTLDGLGTHPIPVRM